jgi:hypothetical protein
MGNFFSINKYRHVFHHTFPFFDGKLFVSIAATSLMMTQLVNVAVEMIGCQKITLLCLFFSALGYYLSIGFLHGSLKVVRVNWVLCLKVFGVTLVCVLPFKAWDWAQACWWPSLDDRIKKDAQRGRRGLGVVKMLDTDVIDVDKSVDLNMETRGNNYRSLL